MFSRLSIIFLFLSLPILITLLAQRLAETVAPPELPDKPISVRMAHENKSSTKDPDDSGHTDSPARPRTPDGYLPRAIERIPLEEQEGQASDNPPDASEETGNNKAAGDGRSANGKQNATRSGASSS